MEPGSREKPPLLRTRGIPILGLAARNVGRQPIGLTTAAHLLNRVFSTTCPLPSSQHERCGRSDTISKIFPATRQAESKPHAPGRDPRKRSASVESKTRQSKAGESV